MTNIENLIKQLDSADLYQQADAAKALITAGEPAVESLIRTLNTSQNDQTQMRAASALCAIKDQRAVPALVEHSRSPSQKVRHAIIFGLRSFVGNQQAAEALQRAAREDADPGIRNYATLSLEIVLPPGQTVPVWIEMLKSANVQDQRNAAQKLGDSGNVSAVEPLIAALKRVDKSAFGMTIHALGKLKDGRAFEPIAAYLNDQDGYTRGVAVQALGVLGDSRAVPVLEKLLNDNQVAWKEDYGPSMTVGAVAREALKQIKR